MLSGVDSAVQQPKHAVDVELEAERQTEREPVRDEVDTAFGAGALVGSLGAVDVVKKVPLMRLAAVAIVAMALPLWLLAISMPRAIVIVVLAAFGFCAPFVNAPMTAVMTVRTPEPLRPKVMTAVVTIANVIGPLGFLAAGFGLQYVSLKVLFLLAAAGFTVGALAFSAAVRPRSGLSAQRTGGGTGRFPQLAP